MTAARDGKAFKSGDVVYFYHLFLATVRDRQPAPHPATDDTFVFRVNGKARPMLIVDRIPYHSGHGGSTWYRVLPITTKGTEHGRPKPGHEPIGPCIDGNRPSYVNCYELTSYPDALLSAEHAGPLVQPVDPNAIQNILSVVSKFRLGWRDTARNVSMGLRQ